MNIPIYILCWFTLTCLQYKSIWQGFFCSFNSRRDFEMQLLPFHYLHLEQHWDSAKEIYWGFLFINNLRLLFSKETACFGLYTLIYLETAKLSGKAKVSTSLLRCLTLGSQKTGHAVTQSMIKIFSKCVKENNLLLLSPSGGNCCLGGLRCALTLKVPVSNTDSGFKPLMHVLMGWVWVCFSSSTLSHRQLLPSLCEQSDQSPADYTS